MIKVTTKGSFKNTNKFLQRMKKREQFRVLEKYGSIGVNALKAATPVDEGETAAGWYYEIIQRPGYFSLQWLNSHKAGDIPVAILIQYGHGTGTGGYVQGRDFINPAMRPIFDRIAADMWREVTK